MIARENELIAIHVTASRSTKMLDAMARAHASLQFKVNVLHPTAERREGVLRDFV